MTVTKRSLGLAGAVVIAAVVGFAGIAGAAATRANSSHDTSRALPVPASAPNPHYNRNASGETYGSAAQAGAPAQEPDLILVISNQGKQGYVKKKDLDPPAFTKPQDALAWQAKVGTTRVLKVYESDGKTAIGTFTVGPGEVFSR